MKQFKRYGYLSFLGLVALSASAFAQPDSKQPVELKHEFHLVTLANGLPIASEAKAPLPSIILDPFNKGYFSGSNTMVIGSVAFIPKYLNIKLKAEDGTEICSIGKATFKLLEVDDVNHGITVDDKKHFSESQPSTTANGDKYYCNLKKEKGSSSQGYSFGILTIEVIKITPPAPPTPKVAQLKFDSSFEAIGNTSADKKASVTLVSTEVNAPNVKVTNANSCLDFKNQLLQPDVKCQLDLEKITTETAFPFNGKVNFKVATSSDPTGKTCSLAYYRGKIDDNECLGILGDFEGLSLKASESNGQYNIAWKQAYFAPIEKHSTIKISLETEGLDADTLAALGKLNFNQSHKFDAGVVMSPENASPLSDFLNSSRTIELKKSLAVDEPNYDITGQINFDGGCYLYIHGERDEANFNESCVYAGPIFDVDVHVEQKCVFNREARDFGKVTCTFRAKT